MRRTAERFSGRRDNRARQAAGAAACAGLRTFAPDRVLVVGEDPTVKGFFWLAGQGGCGIETSPAVGEIAADLLLEGRTARLDAALLAPTRSMTG